MEYWHWILIALGLGLSYLLDCFCRGRRGERNASGSEPVLSTDIPEADRRSTAQVSVDGKTIDLHGLTVKVAKDDLEAFIKNRQNRRSRYIKIITGQGIHSPAGPQIKLAVEEYLKYNKYEYEPEINNPGKFKVWLRR